MKRILSGLLIISLGLAILLANIDAFSFREMMEDWWPLFVIAAGALILANNRRDYIWGAFVILAGGVLLLNNLDVVEVNVGDLIFPAVLVTVGLQVLLQSHKHSLAPEITSDEEIVAIFSGASSKNVSSDYKGGKITAIFGGTETDLSKVSIKESAVLGLNILCGGVELRVPENVVVKSRANVILGGIEDKTSPAGTGEKQVLYLEGNIILGGVEIKR